ncbi:MAG: alpha-L-fucosidase [Armatimonadetes bacterium]|nr:alpha-L-fucosidase [Armatimonadota bacterium]
MENALLSYEERMRWFHQARFGIFIHWGLYSILGRGEWVMKVEHIPAEEYAEMAKQFNPSKFDARNWMSLIKESGAKYVVLTTRHHDGFCLYDSKVSDFTSVKTAARRDFVAEYVGAARDAGLKVGFYYSWLDWRFPGYYDHKAQPDSAKAMVDQAGEQIRELMTNYGKIDILWYDGHWVPGLAEEELADFWHSREVNAMVRSLQPHILINNRCGLTEDIDTPEQHVTASQPGRGWESCMTMGDACGWGYIHNNPNFKTSTQLIQYLVTAASTEGNFLLNIGPKPDGTIREEEAERLKAIGKWVKVNGESVFGSRRYPFEVSPWGVGMIGTGTAKEDNVYIHVFRWPQQGEICIPGFSKKIISAIILGTGQTVTVELASNGRTFLKALPAVPPDKHDTVIKLVIAD